MQHRIPNKVRAIKTKADQAYAQQKWKKALGFYLELCQEMPGDARIRQRLGDTFNRAGKQEEAILEYKAAVSIYSNDGFWAKAIALNKMILTIDPQDLEVQRKLADMYAQQDTSSVTNPEAKPLVDSPPKKALENAAISISGLEPRDFETSPEEHGFLGGTISISGEQPRSMDEPEQIESLEEHLGVPLQASRSIPLLSEMSPDEFTAVLDRLTVRHVSSGSVICKEGGPGDSMFILSEGVVDVSTVDKRGTRVSLCQLHGGDFFGEYSLLTKKPRNATVQASSDVELLEISWDDFEFIAARYPRVWNILEDYLRNRMMDGILQRSPVFRVLSPDERQELLKLVNTQRVKSGDLVMEEGSPGDQMYFVKSGTLGVTIVQKKEHLSVGELQPGDYFGEVSLLTGKPRTATVMAKTDCELFVLTRVDAAPVFKKNRDLLVRLKEEMVSRAQETADAFQSYQEARKTLDLV